MEQDILLEYGLYRYWQYGDKHGRFYIDHYGTQRSIAISGRHHCRCCYYEASSKHDGSASASDLP